jgi:hypothetical protein
METEALLKSILNDEYQERKGIGSELHASKAYLNELSRIISECEKKTGQKINLKTLDEQKQLISEFLIVLKDIRANIYPPIFALAGILVGVKQYIVNYQKNHPINVDVEFALEEQDKLGNIYDIRFYKTCIQIIDCMFLCKAKTLEVRLKCDDHRFEFDVLAKYKKASAKKFDLERKLNVIKGHICWAEGEIQEETNWKDRFRIIFNLNR